MHPAYFFATGFFIGVTIVLGMTYIIWMAQYNTVQVMKQYHEELQLCRGDGYPPSIPSNENTTSL